MHLDMKKKLKKKKIIKINWVSNEQVHRNVHNETTRFVEESFRIDYFLYIVDKTISSIENRFEKINILNYIKMLDSFPNTCIAYIILLTIPVTVASVEISFSKLKLIKSYLRSTISQ